MVGLVYIFLTAFTLAKPAPRSVLWHLLAFVFLTALFHLLFVGIFPFTRRDWKAVDYIWLGFASLGVIGVAGESRRLQASWTEADAHWGAGYAFERVKDDVQWNTAYFCLEQWRPRPGTTDVDPVARDFPRACAWFRELAARLPDSLGAELPDVRSWGIPSPPAVESETAVDDIRETMASLATYRQERERFLAAGDEREEDDVEITFKLLGGFLVVFALALRVTKATGELRLETRPRKAG